MPHHNHEDTLTAVHEAGHAVVSLYFDIIPRWVSIRPSDEMSGHTIISGYVGDPVLALKHVIIDLSGHAALIAAGYDPEEARDGTCADFNNAAALLSE